MFPEGKAGDGDRTRDKSLEGSHVTATPHSQAGLTQERRWWWSLLMPSDSRRTRTFDRLLRRQLLYPTELASQVVVPIAANPEPPRGLPQLTMPALFRRSYNQQSHHTGL